MNNKRVAAIIYKKQDNGIEILCLKRSLADGGFWQYLTGTPNKRESDLDALYREINEECSISIDKIHSVVGPFYEFNWAKAGLIVDEVVFSVFVHKDAKIKLSFEHEDYSWLSIKKAIKRLKMIENKKSLKVFTKKILKI